MITSPEHDGAQPLLRPYPAGDHPLANRVVMAPMTRSRATTPDLVPTELHVQYYAQRASAGLIITEGTWVSPTPSAGTTFPDCSPTRRSGVGPQ